MINTVELKETLSSEIEKAYGFCKKLARDHYENFPVASFLLPKYLQDPIAVIYAFARTADDIVDEGDFTIDERLNQLAIFQSYLDNIIAGIQSSQQEFQHIFTALKHVIDTHQLPIELFYDLLKAFKQDITQQDYQTFDELLLYCRYSANPIGRLLLYLTKNASPENITLSDHICTGLQLINFMQDLDSDLQLRNRCYIPKEDLQEFGLSKQHLIHYLEPHRANHLIQFQLKRIQALYNQGKPLRKKLKGLFGLEIRLIIAGGQEMLNQLKSRSNIYKRSKLDIMSWIKIILNITTHSF